MLVVDGREKPGGREGCRYEDEGRNGGGGERTCRVVRNGMSIADEAMDSKWIER